MRITAPRADVASVAAILDRESRLPSPGSKLIDGAWRNICPACGEPIGPFPWRCGACRWSAAARPDLCPCQRVAEISADGSYPISDDIVERIAAAKAKRPQDRTPDELSLARVTVVAEPELEPQPKPEIDLDAVFYDKG